ncbi:MAG: hypothetical protein HRU22_15195, partial [Gammaproteobacteria bacterium]|nr:hypothetical protein [Gammaproteobacteria bacterium]
MKILIISFFLLFVSSPSAGETSTFAKQAQNISYLIEQLVTSNNKLWLNDNIFVDKYIIYNEHGEILIHDCDNSYNSRVKDIGKCLFYDKIHDEFLVNNAYLFNYKLDGIGTFPFAVKVDTSPDSNQNIDSALKLYFHETFHIYQKESFSQTYNTMYTFDNSFFYSATYNKLRINEVKLLLAFIKTGNIDHIKDFYNLRTELISSIKNNEFKQLANLETIEGTAKYIEVQAMESLAQLFGYSYLSNILEHEAAAF